MRKSFITGTLILAVAAGGASQLKAEGVSEPVRVKPAPVAAPVAAPEAAQVQDQPAPVAAPVDVAAEQDQEPAVTFTFRPSSVSMSSSLNFDQDGKVNNSNSNMSVGLRVKYESESQPVMVRNIIATRVVTDTRENLTSQSQGSEQTLFSWENSNNRNARNEFHLHMSFTAPTRVARKLAEISGTMDVIYASGVPAEAVLSPFSDFENKRVTFKDMPGQFIRFSRDERNRGGNNQQQIRVEMPKDLRPHIAKISFYDEAGRELTFNGWGGGSSGTIETRTLNVPLPDKGQIRIQIFPRVETRQVPFTIKDLPIAPDVKPEEGDMMVELKPIDPAGGELRLERLEPVVTQ